jgi:hypothetical protein
MKTYNPLVGLFEPIKKFPRQLLNKKNKIRGTGNFKNHNTTLKNLYWSLCLVSSMGFAQVEHPRISPATTIIQRVGLSEIRVDYSRPGAKGRKIIGEVVPYNRIWRVGANESTKITFSDSVKLNDNWIPRGTYALYAIPHEKEWTIIIHKNTTHWGDGRTKYNADEDQLRFTVTPVLTSAHTENFMISFDRITHQSAQLKLEWEFIQVVFQVEFDTHRQMLVKIKSALASNPSAATYYESARYLQEQNIMLQEAKFYLQRAHTLAGDTYYIHRVWALVEAQSQNFKGAVRHAMLSKVLAAKEGKDEFVRMNEQSILEWNKNL